MEHIGIVLERDRGREHIESILALNPFKIKKFGIYIGTFLSYSIDIGVKEFFSTLYDTNKFLFLHQTELYAIFSGLPFNHKELSESILLSRL